MIKQEYCPNCNGLTRFVHYGRVLNQDGKYKFMLRKCRVCKKRYRERELEAS